MPVDDQVELLGLDDDIQQDLLVFPFIRWLGNANLGEDPPGLAVLAAEEPDVSAAALDQGVFYLGKVLDPKLGAEGRAKICMDGEQGNGCTLKFVQID